MNASKVQVLGFAGSLRSGSYNRLLLRAAQEVAPTEMRIEIYDLSGIPLYNFDVEQKGDPEAVASFKRAIADADGLLISTPEYQHAVPGVLKNALDWASRPPETSVLRRKPVAIMGASPSMTGTARAQTQLRDTLCYNDMRAVAQPEVFIAQAHRKFDATGAFVDEPGRKFIRNLLDKLLEIAVTAMRAQSLH
jgi:chromate reductase